MTRTERSPGKTSFPVEDLLAQTDSISMFRAAFTWPLAIAFSGAATLTASEYFRRVKWGEKLLGGLRTTCLLAAATIVVWPGIHNLLLFSAVAAGAWLASRPIRRFLTIRLLQSGATLARHTNRAGIRRIRHVAQTSIRLIPPLTRRVVRNMRRADVHRGGLENEYFARAGDQMEFLMHILRSGYEESGVGDRFRFDESLSHLKTAHQDGRGVLVLAPHLCGYPILPRVLAEHVPCSTYLRHSPDPAKHALNLLTGQAGGGHLVFPPAGGTPAARLTVALGVLREGRALYVTPDLSRKPDEGVPVSIWNRTAYFPAGVMIMALRTGAAVVLAKWFYRGECYHVRFDAPFWLQRRGNRTDRVQQAMTAFATMMDRHLRRYPEMWWNWLDKRWTRILRESRNP
jgi:lauroyl/myristoyl acyltransferase